MRKKYLYSAVTKKPWPKETVCQTFVCEYVDSLKYVRHKSKGGGVRVMMPHQSGPCGEALCYSALTPGDSGRLAWTQSRAAPLLISQPGKTLKMSAATLLCVKSQVILSPERPSNKSHLQLSVFPSVYPSPSRRAQDWWRDGGKNQCFPASCVMFRDGWCVDGSFSWSVRPDSLHLFPFLSDLISLRLGISGW